MKRLRVLVMTGFETLTGFMLPMEHRSLAWGLDEANIEWRLYNPWNPLPNLRDFDAMYVSVYRFYNRNFVYYGTKREAEARASGLPVISTVEHAHSLHSFYLGRWRDHGITCARFQHFTLPDDIHGLEYPLVLRRDGMHRGSGMYLVRDEQELRETVERQLALSRRTYPNVRGVLPLNLAIEFIETERSGAYYHKYRSYVIGNEVIPAHFMRSRSAFVNYKDAALWAQTCTMDETFRLEGEPHPERLVAAARAVGLEVIALDYSRLPDGRYVFWEGNRVRATSGDAHVAWLGIRDTDILFGTMLARYIRERIDAGSDSTATTAQLSTRPMPSEFLR
jgi:hypothetical protein